MGIEQSRPIKVRVTAPVTLHIYDMGTDPEVRALNRVLKVLGTGAFHCGAEIYGREWSFRGKRDRGEGTGVFWCLPQKCEGHSYHDSLDMGLCHLSEDEVFAVITRLKSAWPGKHYDILKNNCCHFVDSLCRALGVNGLPPWVTSLAGAGEAVANAGEYLEERSTTMAKGLSRAVSSAKEGVEAGCRDGCGRGCVADAGCVASLCVQSTGGPVYRTSSSNPEFIDTAGDRGLVQRLLPTSSPHPDCLGALRAGAPMSAGHGAAPGAPRAAARHRTGSASKTQPVPRSRVVPSHARYLPREAEVPTRRPPSVFLQGAPETCSLGC